MRTKKILTGTILLSCWLIAFSLSAQNRSVAILPLKNLTQDAKLDYLSKSIPGSLAVSLQKTGKFRIIDQDLVQKTILSNSGFDYQQSLLTGQGTSADITINGSFSYINETIDISLEAIDNRTGRIKVTEGARGEAGMELFDLIDGLCNQMSARMSAALPPLTDYEKGKTEQKVDEIYSDQAKRENVFLASMGYVISSSANSMSGFPNQTLANGTLNVHVGYGFKRFLLQFGGGIPLGTLNTNIPASFPLYMKGDFFVIPQKLALRASFTFFASAPMGLILNGTNRTSTFSYDMTPYLGITYKPIKTISLSLSFGMPLLQQYNDFYINMTTSVMEVKAVPPLVEFDFEWQFLPETALRIDCTYLHATGLNQYVLNSFSFTPQIAYKAQF